MSRGIWRLRAPIVGLLSVLLLAACADSTAAHRPTNRSPRFSAPAPIPAAQARIFTPDGAQVTSDARGTCWTSSITVQSRHAYRCFAAGEIFDPCFAARGAGTAVCFADPWTPGVRVVLTAKLPVATPLAVTHPWALELANGARCVASTGVVNHAGGVALLYRCDDGGTAGAPSTAAGQTRVEYAAAGAHTVHPVTVTVTWQA